MNAISRRMAAGLLALGVAAGCSGTAHAAEKTEDLRYRFDTVVTGVDNPCPPEFDDITLNAWWLGVSKRWDTGDGEWRLNFHVTTHLSGTAADGTRYSGSNQFAAHDRVDDGVVTIAADNRTLLVSQGSDPNFVLRHKTVATFELNGPNGSFEVLKDFTECRG
ncbi:MAG: hypothetical protein ACRD2W_19965 [Acidimicrobiales bacterium]